MIGVLVAGLNPDLLTSAERIVAGVPLLNGLLEEGRSIGIDDDGGPGFPVEDGLANLHRVIIEVGRVHGDKSEMVAGCA